MLTVKEINEVSFGKAGFSGYKPEDVDNFIDDVAASFGQLEAERDEALKRAQELAVQNSELSAKNAELQEKLAILAQKIETYREDEDGIKDALLSAQKMAKSSVQEAKDKAQLILQDAEDGAKELMDEAKIEASKAAREYMLQAEEKKAELEEMKRQVSAFRSSLMEMYKKHLECIDHIPNFRQKEQPEEAKETGETEEAEGAAVPQEPDEPAQAPAIEPEPEEKRAVEPEREEPADPPQRPEPQVRREPQQPIRQQPRRRPPQPTYEKNERPTLHDRVDYTKEQLRPVDGEDSDYPESDLSEVGIDLKTYSDIPETLKREKNNNFSNLEFGDDVDLGKKKRKR